MSQYIKKKYYGVVFLSVLIFFQLITLLSFYLLQANFISKKMNTAYWQHDILYRFAKGHLQYIESNHLSEDCYIDVMTQFDLLAKPFNWWLDRACAEKIDEISYYYVIEVLNNTACIKLNSVPINYFRITLVAYSKNKVFREILQSVVIKLDNAIRECANDDVNVDLGRQSLRRL